MGATPAALLDATAELIAAGTDVGDQIEAGLRAILHLIDADRADAGLVGRASSAYRPLKIEVAAPVPATTFEVPVSDPLVQRVMRVDGTAFVADVGADLASGPVRDLLVGSDTRSVVVRRLDHHDDGYGLVCIDWVGRSADVPSDAVELVDHFVSRIWSPLLCRSVAEGSPRSTPDPLAPLSAAERAVVDLAAAGYSYREIADRRHTSVNTVGQQLRAARRKVGARNTAELCRLAGLGPRRGSTAPRPAPWQDPAMARRPPES